jgi:Protein kinase domain/WD40-like Beta Propeller Repeat
MTLTGGMRLGPYEILSPIGAGGMGEVYRARDAKLGRDVAIKVLPAAFASDVERLARFRREAQVLASLAHPNVAHIYGVEEADGVDALVLELVEGETLAERIARGPLPVDEALDVARQIADALEAAHEKGIVHRDLKPANVKLTPDGRVKVLDFGLAKAMSADVSSPDVTHSPTLSVGATKAGVILGTAAYMSPEQATGRPVDRRTDIWAFGAVLFEMLAGRPAFRGETVSETLAAVLRDDVNWSLLPAETPASVRRVLRRCLDRDVKTRFRDATDARIEMDQPSEAAVPPVATPVAAERRAGRFGPWLAAVLAVVAAAGWFRALSGTPAPATATHLSVVLPMGDQLPYEDNPVVALSRDGRQLVYVSEHAGSTSLVLRPFGAAEGRVIEGTADATDPFFSADGHWIGFFAEGKLKKVAVGGGLPMVLADAPNPRGGAWLSDDRIVFSPEYTSGLCAVPARGGKVEILTKPDAGRGERTHRWPAALPGEKELLFTVGSVKSPSNYDQAEIHALDLATGKTRKVLDGGSMARYVPESRLAFLRNNTLLVAPFDPKRVALTGDAAPVLEKVGGDTSGGSAYAAFAADGTLAFVLGAWAPAGRTLVLVDRSGKATDVPLSPRLFEAARFSPDGKRIAFSVGSGGGQDDDVFVYDIAPNVLTRLTFSNTGLSPVWSPDGKRIAYGALVGGREGIWGHAADGSGREEALDHLPGGIEIPDAWSDDGHTMVISRVSPKVGVWLLPVDRPTEGGAREVQPGASGGALSPDGRWLAYATGQFALGDVYVEATDGSPGKWQITTERGGWPVWRGKEIFFLRDGGDIWSVEVETSPTFRAGTPRVLYRGEGRYNIRTAPLYPWDVSSDGQRFALLRNGQTTAANRIDVVLGWASELPRGLRP